MYYTYCEVIIVFGIAAIYIKENTAITFAYYQVAFFYLVPIFSIIVALLSQFLFQKNLTKVHQKTILNEKLTQYQTESDY